MGLEGGVQEPHSERLNPRSGGRRGEHSSGVAAALVKKSAVSIADKMLSIGAWPELLYPEYFLVNKTVVHKNAHVSLTLEETWLLSVVWFPILLTQPISFSLIELLCFKTEVSSDFITI